MRGKSIDCILSSGCMYICLRIGRALPCFLSYVYVVNLLDPSLYKHTHTCISSFFCSFNRNYLAHTQGKKHQAGLAKRAAMEAKLKGKDVGPVLPASSTTSSTAPIRRVKIGRPGYEITKSRHYQTNQRCLSFQLHFPEIESGVQPRHRFMSAFEQRVESPPDRRFQYLLIAAEPYETVAFKIPNEKIERSEGMFVTNWDRDEKKFTLTLYFVDADGVN